MNTIQDDLYRMLAVDYVTDGEKSVIYQYYYNEDIETVAGFKQSQKQSERKSGKSKLTPCEQIIADYEELTAGTSEAEVHLFLAKVFRLLANHEVLYNQTMVLSAPVDNESSDSYEPDFSEDIVFQREHYLIAPEDFKRIWEAVSPFLTAAFCLTDVQKAEILNTRSKNKLHEMVKSLSEIIDESSVKRLLSDVGLLKPDSKELTILYHHIISRSIDKTYKDALYSAGYRLLNFYGEAPILKESKTRKKENGSKIRREKRDKTMILLEAICRKKGIQSLSSLTDNGLDEPSLVPFCQNLYREVNQKKNTEFSLVIHTDSQTGCSLQLVGSHYFPKDFDFRYSCAFVILHRYADEGAYTYDILGDDDNDDSDTYYFDYDFHLALEEYKMAIEDARIDIQSHSGEAAKPDFYNTDSRIRQDTMTDIMTLYEDEEPELKNELKK